MRLVRALLVIFCISRASAQTCAVGQVLVNSVCTYNDPAMKYRFTFEGSNTVNKRSSGSATLTGGVNGAGTVSGFSKEGIRSINANMEWWSMSSASEMEDHDRFSLSFWFMGATNAVRRRLLRYSCVSAIDIGVSSVDKTLYYETNPYPSVDAVSFEPTGWTHVVVVHDYATIIFYVNGIQRYNFVRDSYTKRWSNSARLFLDATSPVRIDDARIYNRVITANEAMWLAKPCYVDTNFYFNTYTCPPCPSGFYGSGDNCTACAAGTESLAGCRTPCVAGEYVVGVGCMNCEAGKFSVNVDSPSCVGCLPGAYSTTVRATSATVCVICPINTFSGEAASACQPCQENATSAAGSTSQAYCYCKSGYAHAIGSHTCRICDPGTYNSHLGRMACSNCSVGLYSVNYGATGNETCLSCPLGQWSPEGSPNCNLCPVNSFAGPGSGSQTNCNCNAGYTGPNGGLCLACAAGQYKNATGAGMCVSCPVGSSSPNASSSVSNCTCSSGYANIADVCTAVIARAVQIRGTLKAVTTDSSPGDITAAMSQLRYQIAAKLGIPVGLVQIERIYSNPGRALLSDEIAIVVTISATSTTELSVITAGTVDLSTIEGLSGASMTIVQGTNPLSNLTCSACPANSYYAQGQCLSCTNNTVSVPGSLGCQCKAGFTGSPDACQACPAGTYKRMAGTSACRACQANSRSDAASALCRCNAGYTANTGDVCVACVAGTYKNATGSAACVACAQRRNSVAAATNVTQCICDISYTQVENAALTFDVVYAQACVACDVGKFKPLIGVQECTPCGQNQSSLAASPICSCVAGFTGPDGGPCSECAIGKYKDWLGSQACTTCPADANTAAIRSTLLTNCTCNTGYTGPNGGPCTACVGGKYKNVTGTSLCISCDVDYYSNLDTASTICVSCPSNSISPSTSIFSGCACVVGYSGLSSVSLTKSCGANVNTACDASYGGISGSSAITATSALTDGDTNTISDGPGFTSWIRIDFGRTVSIQSVVLWNGNSWNHQYWYNYYANDVSVFMSQSSSFDGQSVRCMGPIEDLWWTKQQLQAGTAYQKRSQTLKCAATVSGRYLYLTYRPGTHTWVAFGEIEVYMLSPCTACASGTYKSIIGTSTCLSCPVNTYHNTTAVSSVTGCLGCPENSVSLSGESICFCDKGSTGPDGGPCVKCESGKYKNWRNSSTCPVCHSNADSTEGFALCTCNAGYTGSVGSSNEIIDLLQACGSSENQRCAILGCGNAAVEGSSTTKFNDKDFTEPSMGGISCQLQGISPLPIDFGSEKIVTSVIVYIEQGWCSNHFCGCDYTVRVGNTPPGLYPATNNDLLCPAMKPANSPLVTISGTVLRKFTIDCGKTLKGRYFTLNKEMVAWSGAYNYVHELQVIGFKDYTACVACGVGKYKNKTLSNDVCTTCPANSYEPDFAAVAVTNCTCNTGFDGAAGGPCTACAVGKYKNNNDTTPCVECPVDTYIDVEASSYCKVCPEFTTSPVGSASIAACLCRQGYTGGGGAVTVGVISSNLGRSCGVNSDQPCVSSQSTTRGGQDSWYALDGNSNTMSFTEAGAEQWFRIDFGRTVYVQSFSVVIMRYWEVEYHKNFQVRVGNVDAASSNPSCYTHSGMLTTLGAGINYWTKTIACTTPRAGRYLYFVNPAAGTNYINFVEFAPSGFSTPPETACSACVIGKYKDTIGSSWCTSCPPSTFSGAVNATSIETCSSCQGNSTSLLGSASKDYCQCNVGFIHEGAGCAACLPGTFNPRLAQIACSNCTVGTYSLNYGAVSNETCATCKETEYSPEGSALCQPCPPNSVAAAGSSRIQDCGCTFGYTGATASLCEKCAPGSFKNITGNWLCQSCSVNSYSLSGATALTACFCNPGYTGAYGPFCVACVIGKYKSIYGSSACTDCPVNTYADRTGMTVCTSCVATSASPVASVTIWNCTCNAGYKGPTYLDVVYHENFARSCGGMRSSACVATQSSTLTTQVSVGVFEPMNPATLANDNSSSTFSMTAYGTNQWWRVDFERRVTVQSVRLLFSTFAVDMLHVHVGDVNSSTANLICASVPVNTGSSDWVTATCSSALTGRYLYVRNSIASQVTLLEVQAQGTEVLTKIWPDWCKECPVGTYKPVTGNVECTNCPSNRFSSSLAATSISTCLSCPANSVAAIGSDQCACDVGFSGPANACTACASDTFKTAVGSGTCAVCPANSVIAPNASTLAMPCTCLSGFEPR